MAAKKIRERGERREKSQTLTKATRLYLQILNLAKKLLLVFFFLVRKWEGAYIGHPMYENKIKPNNLAKIRDKRVIHQNRSRFALITKV